MILPNKCGGPSFGCQSDPVGTSGLRYCATYLSHWAQSHAKDLCPADNDNIIKDESCRMSFGDGTVYLEDVPGGNDTERAPVFSKFCPLHDTIIDGFNAHHLDNEEQRCSCLQLCKHIGCLWKSGATIDKLHDSIMCVSPLIDLSLCYQQSETECM